MSDAARPALVLIAAVGRRGELGKDGRVPWHVPEDLKHFKSKTMGHAIVMGRKTWDEVGKPLPGRRNLVVSRDAALRLEGAEVFPSLEAAVAAARETDPEPYVIGGAQIYEAALPLATRVELTTVDREVDADTWCLPLLHLTEAGFREVARRRAETEEGVEFVTLER